MWSQATVNRYIGYNIMGDELMILSPLMESPRFEDFVSNINTIDVSMSNIGAKVFRFTPQVFRFTSSRCTPQETSFESRAHNP
jgi:hypothetical protein